MRNYLHFTWPELECVFRTIHWDAQCTCWIGMRSMKFELHKVDCSKTASYRLFEMPFEVRFEFTCVWAVGWLHSGECFTQVAWNFKKNSDCRHPTPFLVFRSLQIFVSFFKGWVAWPQLLCENKHKELFSVFTYLFYFIIMYWSTFSNLDWRIELPRFVNFELH